MFAWRPAQGAREMGKENRVSYQSTQQAAQEPAGVRALRETAAKLDGHIRQAQRELGEVAQQYGNLINNYQTERRQINEALIKLVPVTPYPERIVGSSAAQCAGSAKTPGEQLG